MWLPASYFLQCWRERPSAFCRQICKDAAESSGRSLNSLGTSARSVHCCWTVWACLQACAVASAQAGGEHPHAHAKRVLLQLPCSAARLFGRFGRRRRFRRRCRRRSRRRSRRRTRGHLRPRERRMRRRLGRAVDAASRSLFDPSQRLRRLCCGSLRRVLVPFPSPSGARCDLCVPAVAFPSSIRLHR